MRKALPMPVASNIFPALSCTSFKVLDLILRYLIHFELLLVQGDKVSVFCRQLFLKRLSFVYHMFLVPLLKIKWA
jgi:hypothetical protein